jgi:small-conductance mechanosensitive channel
MVFAEVGIRIPFPQRDVHMIPPTEDDTCADEGKIENA